MVNLPDSFIPTESQELESYRRSILNYAKKACLTPIEIKDVFSKLDNVELVSKTFVKYWMPGKKFEDDRSRFIGALDNYQAIQHKLMRSTFLSNLR